MTAARFTLTRPGLTHEAAWGLAGEIEENPFVSPLAVTINETDEARGLWEVVLYFGARAEAEDTKAQMGWTQGLLGPVPEQDWVRLSLEGLAPVIAGRFYLYGAHDRHRRRSGGIALEIDAGTAFGTGHHATTEGCLLALDRLLKFRKPRHILDVGCGTGVLAIAAAKATGRKAIASDIDAEAVRVTRLNARLNGVPQLIRGVTAAGLAHPVLAHGTPYDLIFANILARPLAALATGLSRALKPGGDLILSGLTPGQMRWIEAAYVSRGLRLSHRFVRDNWAALVMRKLA